jgi:CelD/BcsL family acetyltransferase involved in cellulose biosynthesis
MSLVPQPAAAFTTAPLAATLPGMRVEVLREAASAAAVWAELERAAPATIYQSLAWSRAWLETFGMAGAASPMVVVARTGSGAAIALLPLSVTRKGPVKVAGFLGGKESNFNVGLFRSPAEWSAASLRALLTDAARAMGADGPDLFLLQNQPLTFAGRDNPLARLPHQAAPSAAFESALSGDAEGFLLARLSKEGRKKLRKKETRLAGMGALRHIVARDAATAARILEALLSQKRARFDTAAAKAHFEDPTLQRFLAALAKDGTGPLELHALTLDDRIVATYAGALHQGRFSCMYNSFDADPEIAKSSPGEILLTKLIAAKCIEGVTRFDLGIGEARYKNSFCTETVALVDSVVPVTLAGHVVAPFVAGRLRLKRMVKQNPRLMALARHLQG